MPNVTSTNISGGNYGPNVSIVGTQQGVLSAASLPLELYYPPRTPYSGVTAAVSWYKVSENLSYLDFAQAATTLTIALFVLPATAIIQGIKIKPKVAFKGLSSYTVSVGIASNTTQLASAYDVTVVSATNFQLSSNFIAYSDLNPTTITATAVCTGGNLNAATIGSLDIYALLSFPG